MFLGQVENAGFSLSVAGKKGKGISQKEIYKLEAAGLAQSLERLTAEREVVDSIAGLVQILEGTERPFALQSARVVYPIRTFALNTVTLVQTKCIF